MGVNAIIDSAHLYFQSPLLQKYVRFNTTLRNNLSCENKAQQGFDEWTQQNILVVFENPPFPYGLQTSKTHFNSFYTWWLGRNAINCYECIFTNSNVPMNIKNIFVELKTLCLDTIVFVFFSLFVFYRIKDLSCTESEDIYVWMTTCFRKY